MSSKRTIEKGGLFYGWIIVATCLLVTTISFGCGYTFGVFLPVWREAFGWSTAAISVAYSICLLSYTTLSVFAGWGADTYGPKITTVMGGVLVGSGLIWISHVHEIWQLYMAYGLIGAGMSCYYSPFMTTVSRWFVRRRGLALGIFSSGISAGTMIIAPIASYLISAHGWRSTFVVMASANGIVILSAFLLRTNPAYTATPPQGQSRGKGPLKAPSVPARSDTESRDFTFKEALQTKAFWLISGVFFAVGVGLQMVLAHIVAYSRGMGLSPMRAAVVLSTITGSSIVGRILLGAISDRIGRKTTLAISVFLEGSMILCLIAVSNPWMIFVIAAVFGFGYGGHGTQIPVLYGETLGLRHMGAILGGGVFFWGLGGSLGAILAGHIFDLTGQYTSAFAIGATAMLSAAVVTFFLKRPVRKKELHNPRRRIRH